MPDVIFNWLDMSDDIEISYRELHRVPNVYQRHLYLVSIITICLTGCFYCYGFSQRNKF